MNDQVKQNGCTSDMIFKIPVLIEHVSSIMTLEVRIRVETSPPLSLTSPVLPRQAT